MREPAMVSEGKRPPAKPTEHVEVRRLCRQGRGQRRQSSLAVEAGTAQARAEQKVGDRFQAFEESRVRGILLFVGSLANRHTTAGLTEVNCWAGCLCVG